MYNCHTIFGIDLFRPIPEYRLIPASRKPPFLSSWEFSKKVNCSHYLSLQVITVKHFLNTDRNFLLRNVGIKGYIFPAFSQTPCTDITTYTKMWTYQRHHTFKTSSNKDTWHSCSDKHQLSVSRRFKIQINILSKALSQQYVYVYFQVVIQ